MKVDLHLDAQALQSLKDNLIGHPVLSLYTTTFWIRWPWCIASYLAIRRNRSFLVIRSDWEETEGHLLDYHMMEVSLEDSPEGIEVQEGASGTRYLGPSVSVLDLDPPKSPCTRIEVMECTETHADEYVSYDAALILHLNDKRRFAICANRSIAGGVAVTLDYNAIQSLVEEYTIRAIVS